MKCLLYFEDHPQNGTLRLVDGSNATTGRLEVFHDRKWGTICDDSFGKEEAQVICPVSTQRCILSLTLLTLPLCWSRTYESNVRTYTISSLRLKPDELAIKKEGRNWVLRRFQQLRSYRDEIETCNREIPYSSGIVPMGLSVAEAPKTVLNNTALLYSDQANLLGDQAETRTCELTLGSQAS